MISAHNNTIIEISQALATLRRHLLSTYAKEGKQHKDIVSRQQILYVTYLIYRQDDLDKLGM